VIQRNITEIPIPSAFTRSNSGSSTSLPTLSNWQNDNSPDPDLPPAWEPPSRQETEGELKALKLQQKALSRAMTWAVDSLLLQDSDLSDPRKREAFECLSYVRDVLAVGKVTNLDLKMLTRQQGLPTQADNRVVETGQVSSPPEEDNREKPLPTPNDGSSFPMLLSRRDFKPAVSLTRTPYLSREPTPSQTPPNATSLHRPSASYAAPSLRTEYFASPAPASATNSRFATSPATSSSPRPSAAAGQRSPPPNPPMSAIEPLQKSVAQGKEPTSPWSPTSVAQQPSAGYPPRRSEDQTQQKSSNIVDPLGVLR
jgi:hypothetical protein